MQGGNVALRRCHTQTNEETNGFLRRSLERSTTVSMSVQSPPMRQWRQVCLSLSTEETRSCLRSSRATRHDLKRAQPDLTPNAKTCSSLTNTNKPARHRTSQPSSYLLPIPTAALPSCTQKLKNTKRLNQRKQFGEQRKFTEQGL